MKNGFRYAQLLWHFKIEIFLSLGIILATEGMLAQVNCTFTQITHTVSPGPFRSAASSLPSLDGSSIAFQSNADVTGRNPDGNHEIVWFDGSILRQITDSVVGNSRRPSLDDGLIAFESNADLTSRNPDLNFEIFLFNGSRVTQITDTVSQPAGASFAPSVDDGSIAFVSSANLTGDNADGTQEVYLFDGSVFTQITRSSRFSSSSPTLDDGSIAFESFGNFTGDNSDISQEIFFFDGSEIKQISDGVAQDLVLLIGSFDPSLDGGSIAFESNMETSCNLDLSNEIFFFNGERVMQVTAGTRQQSSFDPSLDQGVIAFASTTNPTGENPDGNSEIFLFDGSEIVQITDSLGAFSGNPSLDGSSVAFESNADFTGGNSDGNREIFLATCSTSPNLHEIPVLLRTGRATFAILLLSTGWLILQRLSP